MIPLSVPCLRGNEWKYVKECLDTEWVSSVGQYVNLFEDKLVEYTGAKHAVACVNGTAALQVALRIVGVSPGDEVIAPTVTFIAPINAVNYLGAVPVFMDCDEYYNIDAEKTLEFLRDKTVFRDGATFNAATGKRVAALMPVHVFGNAARLDVLLNECRERRIPIVEDASESLGSRYKPDTMNGAHTGTVGDIGCVSFNGNKIITTGGGGMLLTDNAEYAEKARYLTTQAKDDGVRYVHDEVGYNLRLTNVLSAIGVAQMEQLPEFIEAKRKNYQSYKERIDAIPGLNIAPAPDYADSNYWMYCLQIDAGVYPKDREQLMNVLSASEIQSRPVWHLNHLQKPYAGCERYRIERAIDMHAKSLCLPSSVTLTQDDIAKSVGVLAHG